MVAIIMKYENYIKNSTLVTSNYAAEPLALITEFMDELSSRC